MFRGTSGKLSVGFVIVCLLVVSALSASAGIDTSTPISFFTNLASRLLRSELNLDLTHIQIYPTNQYTPAVHRLLQVTANIYDATTNRTDTGYPYLPTVFRPQFSNDGGSIFICGYVEEIGTTFLDRPLRDLDDSVDRAAMQPDDSVWGVPLVIGAKKGLPNFNEFAMQSAISARRRLEFRRVNWESNGDPTNNPVAFTNQLYSIGVSNVFGVEAWNSYTRAFPRPLELSARCDLTIVFYETNSANQEVILGSTLLSAVATTNILANTWRGITNSPQGSLVFPVASFVIPLQTNLALLQTNIAFLQSSAGFDGVQGHRQNVGNTFPITRWWAKLNWRVRYLLLDDSVSPARIVDYVSLNRHENAVNVTSLLMTGATGQVFDNSGGGQWATNRVGNSPSLSAPTVGIVNQITAGLGQLFFDWSLDGFDPVVVKDKTKAIQFFKINLGGLTPTTEFQMTNVFYAPFVPLRTIFQHVSWQANDPLVHYTLPDLLDSSRNTVDFAPANPLGDLRGVNYRYQPWGMTHKGVRAPGQPGQFNPANKDPLVYQSDNWEFPTNLLDDLSQIGQVHRGTPWQTIYLKSLDMTINAWSAWTGNSDLVDAARTRPVQDRHIPSLFTALLNTNDPRSPFSANNSDTNAWLNVLNGFVVLTNNLSEAPLPGRPAGFDQLVMTSNSPQASFIAKAIAVARNNQPNHLFRSPGDVLSVAELSVASPWLNFGLDQARYGISEEAYEAIPNQLLLLLRAYSFGSVITTNNQSLVQFTGYDDDLYAVQVSSNLTDWTSVSTNYPVNGVFNLPITMPAGAEPQFYRSVLLP